MLTSHSWFYYLCALEGAAAIAALFLIPSEGGSLSIARLSLIAFIALIGVAWMVLGLRRSRLLERLARPAVIFLAALLALTFGLLLFGLRYVNPESSLSTYQRLSPLLWYLLVLSLQIFLVLLILYKGFYAARLTVYKPLYLSVFLVFCGLLIFLFLIAFTRLGLTPDPAYWGEPGVPILGWQFALALLAGIAATWLSLSRRDRAIEWLLPLGIYVLAVILWLGVPVEVLSNSFYMPINPPTFQPFPYSDAGYYDQMAQSLLIGHPYQGTIPTRPLYIFLLTVLHLFFGESYRYIILGQTLVLGIIPVILYFLGKQLHSRVAGVIVALFFIFRELTTLWVSSNTRVSSTKTLLVDLPTLLLLSLACLFAIRWLKERNERYALMAGGMFGLLLLLRTQSMLVLPLILLAAVLVFGWKTKAAYILVSVFFFGLFVAVLPWLTHNYLYTGQFAFDAPFQYKIIATQYAYTGNLDIENFDFEGKGLGRMLIEFALKDPSFVFGFIANHFLATQIHGLLVLPLIKPYKGIFEPINLYWMEWNGSLEWYNTLLVISYLFIIAIGLCSAWRRGRWIGLLPLAFSLGYALATAIGRFSGWRYDLPADWVWYFYFGVGAAELFVQAALLFGADQSPVAMEQIGEPQARMGSSRLLPSLALVALLFAFLGALPWLIKGIASPRYENEGLALFEQTFLSNAGTETAEQINAFLSQPDAFLQVGRVLYPRFFSKDDGLASANPWPAYALRDYPRMGFLLLNESSIFVVYPTKRLPDFPHARDAIVVGCQRDGYVEARWIAFPELDSIYASEERTGACSP